MAKITAILSGGDWYDASVVHLILPDDMDIDAQKKEWDDWYDNVYRPRRREEKFITFTSWLIEHGAREPTKEELVIWEEI
jgi:hypothetical protein